MLQLTACNHQLKRKEWFSEAELLSLRVEALPSSRLELDAWSLDERL